MYCDLKAAGGLALYCNTMHIQVMTGGWALGWAWQQALGRAGTAQACAGRWCAARARSRRRRHWRGARRACGRRGAAARGTRAEACEARAERSGRAGAGGAQTRGRGARGGRLGAPVLTWACQLGQLGARAPSLVFRPGFRLGDVFESPFEPGS